MQSSWKRGVAPILVTTVVAVALIALLLAYLRPAPDPMPHDVDAFLAQHWHWPMEPQGPPPKEFSPRAASLDAKSCAQCHSRQYEDWQTSRHSRTMEEGIKWQFPLFGQKGSNACMNCHAPLAEQKALVALEQGWPAAPTAALPDYIPSAFHDQGLTCAACHVREHQRFGPPARTSTAGDEEGLPHGGFRAHSAFSDSRFCVSCHQFPDDGPRLNGKLRQDTYNEWLRSDFAARGETCQSCHMPDRRHLWRGASDPGMVGRGMAAKIELMDVAAGGTRVRVQIENVGAGHKLPTYLVPQIQLRLVLVDAQDKQHELARHIIQWRASVDLETEHFDTRLDPGEVLEMEGLVDAPALAGGSIRLVAQVAPKEHYERMYRDMLTRPLGLTPETLTLLKAALAMAEESRFQLTLAELAL